MEKENIKAQRPHIAFLSCPGSGHLYPLAELAKQLVHRHGFSATIITFSNFSSSTQCNLLSSLLPEISSLFLPFIPLDDIPPDAAVLTRICSLVSRSVPHVRDALQSLKKTTRLAAFVPDIFGCDLLPVAKELSIPHYIFFTATCMALLFFLHLPYLHETTLCEYHDLPEPLLLPGCVPLRGEEFIDVVLMDRKSDAYSWMLHVVRGYTSAQGILVNSFEEMEPGASKALINETEKHPPVYLVGPLVRSGSDEVDESGCLDWLDRQSNGSVLFISFGSGGTLTTEQTLEIAFGLEASGQKFLWVVRCPSDKDKSASFFGQEKHDDPLSYLPEGFMERNKERGMVVPLWAPQVKVLAHKAVGGFLSHCGWNSALESVCHGVPMIAWPLYAEQRMNREMLVEGVGIALRPVEQRDGVVEREEIAKVERGDGVVEREEIAKVERGDGVVVEREEIAKVAKELMQEEGGKAARERVERLREAGIGALSEEGSSHLALMKVADQWKDACRECL